MDQIKIGHFIAETQKARNLTQRQLADALSISDKTSPNGSGAEGCRKCRLCCPCVMFCTLQSTICSPGKKFLRRSIKRKRRGI